MSAIPIASHKPRSAGHDWFERHLPELISRCRAFLRRVPDHVREEAQAETLASIFQYVLNAERRGKLSALTPFTLVSCFGRGVCLGRRMTGTSTKDALSEACHRQHGLRVISLDDPPVKFATRGPEGVQLSDALAAPKGDCPFENARRNIDYPEILHRAHANRKVRRVFTFFCETAGAGKQKNLARELGVSEPRVCQLKDELADILAAQGYQPSGTRKSSKKPKKRGRRARRVPRHLDAIPLNAGTSPARRRHDRPEDCRAPRPRPARRLPTVLRNGSEIPQRNAATDGESIKAEGRKGAQTTACHARRTR